jgi:hypothetical protein
VQVRWETKGTKSRAGRRPIPLPDELIQRVIDPMLQEAADKIGVLLWGLPAVASDEGLETADWDGK